MSQYLIERIEQLKAENEQLRKERDAAKNMLEFEQSKHDSQMISAWSYKLSERLRIMSTARTKIDLSVE